MARLVFSSEFYHIKAEDLKSLPVEKDIALPVAYKDTPCVFLKDRYFACLIDPSGQLSNTLDDAFVKVKIVYKSYSFFISFLLCLVKPIKRHFYKCNDVIFRVRLQDIIDARLPRGERNAENAYQWNNKRWQISKGEAEKRYTDLRNSLRENGYDMKCPMFVMLNRKFGAKDQLFQGHHRIGICQELGIEEISISFWMAPATSAFFKHLM